MRKSASMRSPLTDFKRVTGKPRLLFQLAEVSLAQPEGQVKAVIYPAVGSKHCAMSSPKAAPLVPPTGTKCRPSCRAL